MIKGNETTNRKLSYAELRTNNIVKGITIGKVSHQGEITIKAALMKKSKNEQKMQDLNEEDNKLL